MLAAPARCRYSRCEYGDASQPWTLLIYTHPVKNHLTGELGLFDLIQQGTAGRGYNQPALLSLRFQRLPHILLSSLILCQCAVMGRVPTFLVFRLRLESAGDTVHQPQRDVMWDDANVIISGA